MVELSVFVLPQSWVPSSRRLPCPGRGRSLFRQPFDFLRPSNLHGGSMPSNKAIERKDQMSGLAIRLTNGRSLPIEFVTRLKHGSNNDAIQRLHSGRSREIEFA